MTIFPPAEEPADALVTAHQRASSFLLGRINYERVTELPYGKRHMKLDRMRDLLNRLGNPDAGLPIVHVAGTKGKGSTSAMVAGILQSAGYETGLFTSPHLERIEERFVVNGVPCPSDDLVALVEQLRPVVEHLDCEAAVEGLSGPTYFELTTAIALMHFAQRKVDIAVLEVGLGGRLDSTNVCQPIVTVITSISLDHTKQLGETVEEIAAEKAGIIKPGVPVLCGPLENGPRQVIAEIARQHGSRMIESGRDFTYAYHPPSNYERHERLGRFDFSGDLGSEDTELTDIPLRMLGEHQAANAALAIAITAKLRRQGWSISSDAIHETFSQLALPGRIELIRRRPAVVLDVAHNVAAMEALVDVIAKCFSCKNRTLVLAATKDKDVIGIARVLAPCFQRIVVTEYHDNPRAVPTEKLAALVREELAKQNRTATVVIERSLSSEAWQAARQLTKADELICVTGSFFIAAELRRFLHVDV